MKSRMRWMSLMGAVVLAGGPLGAGAEPGPGAAFEGAACARSAEGEGIKLA
ncbi:MAG: hypothetical protein RLZZ142_27 [Verrucomicrobiota bacterium]|jgi:hypothetical protein